MEYFAQIDTVRSRWVKASALSTRGLSSSKGGLIAVRANVITAVRSTFEMVIVHSNSYAVQPDRLEEYSIWFCEEMLQELFGF